MLIWSVTFWHFWGLDGLFCNLDGHFLGQGENNEHWEELYAISGFHFGYREIKHGNLDGHFGTFDKNNGGLDWLNLIKDWRL